MRFPREAQWQFKGTIGREGYVYYILPDAPTPIGYIIVQSNPIEEPPESFVRLRCFAGWPVTATWQFERAGESSLFIVSITQSPGPAWYRWHVPNGQHHVLVQADATDDTKNSRWDMKGQLETRRLIWRVMGRAGTTQGVARRTLEAVGMREKAAVNAIWFGTLAVKALGGHRQQAHALLKKLYEAGDIAALQKLPEPFGFHPKTEKEVEQLAVGAIAALSKPE